MRCQCPTTVTARPAICLNMIVRNEAHIVQEVLDAVAPYITSWVIVDTGSDDGTQDVIRSHMADLGIPGELHERPWRELRSQPVRGADLGAGARRLHLGDGCRRHGGGHPRLQSAERRRLSHAHL